ncbi:Uncharacterized protein FKW44_006483 [Caligus rogercresseyi]|uniref:Uncharacterized protein n=1 Tax=Caligus rogercresseyi TaxID=217165 RepID=A0A7T8QSW5_CALRO|nr:Uncharacterized protein FKW44_006483 [Caligus rogercresseyi]
MDMMRRLQLTVSMVRPQKCMRPDTSRTVSITTNNTSMDAMRSLITSNVVKKTAIKANIMFL